MQIHNVTDMLMQHDHNHFFREVGVVCVCGGGGGGGGRGGVHGLIILFSCCLF